MKIHVTLRRISFKENTAPITLSENFEKNSKFVGQSCKQNKFAAQFVLIYSLLFSTCFGQQCAHHQEKIPYLCDIWYLSLYKDNCLVCRALHTRQSSI